MKRFIFIILLFLPICSYSQTVLGIKLGCNYATVKQSLYDRYGYSKVHDEGGKICVVEPKVGDFNFDYGEFLFQRDESKSYFNEAIFQAYYELSKKNIAIEDRDALFSIIKEKYNNDIEMYVNDDGFKCYKFGTDPTDEDKYLGELILEKSFGKDGITRYYIFLSYGPIYYISRTSDF